MNTMPPPVCSTLPNFLVIGAWKSGTTSLHYYLEQHPDIFMSPGKQSYFFAFEGEDPNCQGPGDEEHHKQRLVVDIRDYRALFTGRTSEKAVGEACSVYLYHPRAPGNIKRHIPDAKLVVMLRNPVDTTYSAFMQQIRDGLETTGDFEEALRLEKNRIRDNWRPMWHYKRRGYYHAQLSRYFDLFAPAQIRIHLYDDFTTDPKAVIQDIFAFLDVDSGFLPDMNVRYNVGGLPKSQGLQNLLGSKNTVKKMIKACLPHRVTRRLKHASSSVRTKNLQKPALPPGTRARLTADFREDILKLQDLIGRDLSAWLA